MLSLGVWIKNQRQAVLERLGKMMMMNQHWF
jgi:hypothetical protein